MRSFTLALATLALALSACAAAPKPAPVASAAPYRSYASQYLNADSGQRLRIANEALDSIVVPKVDHVPFSVVAALPGGWENLSADDPNANGVADFVAYNSGLQSFVTAYVVSSVALQGSPMADCDEAASRASALSHVIQSRKTRPDGRMCQISVVTELQRYSVLAQYVLGRTDYRIEMTATYPLSVPPARIIQDLEKLQQNIVVIP